MDTDDDGEQFISDDSDDLLAADVLAGDSDDREGGEGESPTESGGTGEDEDATNDDGEGTTLYDQHQIGGVGDEPGAGVDRQAGGAHRSRLTKRATSLTVDEQDMLLTAQATSDAPAIQLQAAELVKDLRASLSPAQATLLSKDLVQLRCVLSAISPHTVPGQEAAAFIRDLGLSPAAVSLSFKPPAVVAAVGSLPLGAALAVERAGSGGDGPLTLDVALLMPSECFFRKAHLNYRYHAIRALYLATVINHLAASPAFAEREMQLGAAQHDPARPIIILSGPTTSHGSAPAHHLRLIPCCAPGTFPLPRLVPDRNGVRWASSRTATAGGSSLPTPAYNAGILADMMVLPHAALLAATAARLPAFADGLLLLKAWAAQHGVGCTGAVVSADGLDGHTLAMLLAHLYQQGQLAQGMPAFQVFRCGLQALATSAGLVKGVVMARVDAAGLLAAARAAAPHLLQPCNLGGLQPDRKRAAAVTSEQLQAVVSGVIGVVATTRLDNWEEAAHRSPLLAVSALPHAQFKRAHAATLVDITGWCNVAACVSRAAAGMAASAARACAAVLDAPPDPEAALATVLLTPCRLATAFDYLWSVAVAKAPTYASLASQEGGPSGGEDDAGGHKEGAAEEEGDEEGEQGGGWQSRWRSNALVGDVCVWRQQEAAAEAVLTAGLTDRARVVRVVRRTVPLVPAAHLATGGLPRPHPPGAVLVAARVDPTAALRVVDVGPAADDAPAASRFRDFWGPAAELRRFQDGRICEAVVWGGQAAGPGSRHAIPDQVVSYVVSRHKPGGATGDVRCWAAALDPALRGCQAGADEDAVALTHRRLDAALDKLSKALRALDGPALKVVGVTALGAAARHTAVLPPAPHPLAGAVPPGAVGDALSGTERVPRCLDPIELLVQLENSGRWPSHPVAFQKMKAALGVQLARTVQDKLGLAVQASEEAVDVFSDGFAFRLTLYSGRDEAMLLQAAQAGPGALDAAASASPRLTAATTSVGAETAPLARSWHAGLVAQVAGSNPSFPPAARLAKRWAAAHLLSPHLADEAVELLVAAVYCAKGPRGPPGSRTAGLLGFLQLLATHPWVARPLVVDPDATLTPKALDAILRAFAERRATGTVGAMPAMFIATPRDQASQRWTAAAPTPAVLHRIVGLARTCLAAAGQLLEDDGTAAHVASDAQLLGALFAPQLAANHLVVRLRHEALPRAVAALPAPLDVAPKRARQPDVLSSLLLEGPRQRASHPPKRARVFLDAFPSKALASRGPAALREELLVGFEPLTLLTGALQGQLFGVGPSLPSAVAPRVGGADGEAATVGPAPIADLPPLATLWTDALGGRTVGLQWAPAAFLPAPPKAHACHTSLPCVLTGLGATARNGGTTTKKRARPANVLCVPNVARVLSDVCAMGEGVVEGVHVVASCAKLPVGNTGGAK